MPIPSELDGDLTNEWIWGDTGCGKSRYAHDTYPNNYPKPLNKWWDGYNDQEYILLEEVSPDDAVWLSQKLKIWADRYPFIAEIKGRSRCIRPKKIIVTSNYSLEEVFESKPKDLDALKRRFKEIHMFKRFNK